MAADVKEAYLPAKDIPVVIQELKTEMKEAAHRLEFERAPELRDKIQRLEETELRLR